MVALKESNSFLKALLIQQEINRSRYNNPDKDDARTSLEWGIIAAEHMGHLLGELRKGEINTIEKELLHVAGPLLECWNAIKNNENKIYYFICKNCDQEFSVGQLLERCPLCEGSVEEKGTR